MTVERIKKLDINNRPLFTGIYGYSYGQEYFVESNLCKYNFWQELYRYMRSEGYTTVFYNNAFNFFSYEESQLETLFFKKTEEITNRRNGRFIAPIASPNGHNRRRGIRLNSAQDNTQNSAKENNEAPLQVSPDSPSDQLVSHRPNAILIKKIVGDQFFQLKRSEGVLNAFFDFMDKNPNHKLAIIFTKPSEISFQPDVEQTWRTRLQADFSQQKAADSKHRLIVCYDVKEVRALYDSFRRGEGFFFEKWFADQVFPNYDEREYNLHQPSEALFYVEPWGMDEVSNVIKRKRIVEGVQNTLAPIPFDDLCLRIWQQFNIKEPHSQKKKEIDTVEKLMGLEKNVLERELQKMDNEKAMDKLKKMLGIEGIISKFQGYLDDLRTSRESGEKFRRHMVFIGNPGTGKTTVARIFADILREEGLLENGRLHQVTVGDLVSPYVSDTRIKAMGVCQKAHGGVLFIDEAYGLFQSGSADNPNESGGNQHGKEAIEVLLQFMENDNESLVILAGYPDEMEDLLKNGNVGFVSRIGDQGRFFFDDYKPDVLLKIALSKLNDTGYTEQFSIKLLAIFSMLFRFRDKNWANARTAENTIGSIKSNYRAKHLTGPYDVNAIPDNLMRLIRIPTPKEESDLLHELNAMIGLSSVKTEINKIFGQAKMCRMALDKGQQAMTMSDLTFIFEGNPGTGKTTVARLMGKILAGYGLILKPEVKEYGLGNIVSGIHGGSVKKVNEMFDDSIGKVLFIDEAYALAAPQYKEIVDQIVQNLTSPKYQGKMAVILAGYPNDMRKLADVNTGFDRRFKYHFHFQDYNSSELLLMFKAYLKDHAITLADGCDDSIRAWFNAHNRKKNPHNAGLVKELYDEIISLMGLRLANSDDTRILPSDIPSSRNVTSLTDEEVLAELNKLIGLNQVKETIQGIIADVRAGQIRAQAGQVEESKIGLNFVFKGNPGTGKTTVARLLGNILANYGLIDSPQVITCTKGNLIDGYVGGGSRNMEEFFEQAAGKVLFIDEAYQLATPDSKDALDALTNLMTDPRFKDNIAIVLAGYPGEMAELIASNPGLNSRFTQDIFFENYSNDELTEIFRIKLLDNNFNIGPDALAHAKAYFASLKRNKDFGNARETEKLIEKTRTRQGRRLAKMPNPSKKDIFTILPQDFPNYGKINVASFLPDSPSSSIQEPMAILKNLVGIDDICKQFEDYISMAHFCRNNPLSDICKSFRPHMAFLGNPGTGKTTVARLFGEILLNEGLLTSNNFVEVKPTDLIGQYMGQTGPLARKQFERARGGILFIDEAYQLCRRDQVTGGDQYGKEAITELITFMEDDRDTIVILAGYTDDIRYLIQHGNPGLPSRVTNEFIFEDYQPDVLFDILMKKLHEFQLSDNFKVTIRQVIDYLFLHRKPKEWGNARVMENLASDIFRIFLSKHNAEGIIGIDCIPETLLRLVSDNTSPSSTSPASVPTVNTHNLTTATLCLDLTKNPLDRRVADPNMLKEHATGLLQSHSGEGTAFVISIPDRYILTCSHVVEGAGDELSFSMNCNRDFQTSAHLLWSNYQQDMALLQLDELPEDACYVQIDNNTEQEPQGLTELVLCGYPDGSAFASTPSLISGAINNYEKEHVWNDRCFDTIYANVSATHGCSGGPVVRKNDMQLVGILQGGKEGGEIQFITDIHQLFDNINIKS